MAYLYVRTPIFHQLAYGVLVAALTLRILFLLTNCPKSESKTVMKSLIYRSLSMFFLGFLLWNVDNMACFHLRNTRKTVGPYIGILTELHGWWHILSAFSSYYLIVFNQYLRAITVGEGKACEVRWLTSMVPYVARIDKINLKTN